VPDQDSDPLVRGSDPRIRVLTKCHGSATLLVWIGWAIIMARIADPDLIQFKGIRIRIDESKTARKTRKNESKINVY
jgi:hypothetical protein